MDDQITPEPKEPANLRWLRWLVSVLTITLILGVVTIVTLLVIRMNEFGAVRDMPSALPETLQLPAGETLTGWSVGSNWHVAITRDAAGVERIHLIAPQDGMIVQSVIVAPSAP